MAKRKSTKKSAAKKQEIELIDAKELKTHVSDAATFIGHVMYSLAEHEPVSKSLLKQVTNLNGKLVAMAENIEAKVKHINARIEREATKDERKAALLAKKQAQLKKLQAQVEKLESE